MHIRIHVDASACKGILLHQGAGQVQHLTTKQLNVHGAVQAYGIEVLRVVGTQNWADFLTHPTAGEELTAELSLMHFRWEPQNVHLVGPVALRQVEGKAQTIGCDTCGGQHSARTVSSLLFSASHRLVHTHRGSRRLSPVTSSTWSSSCASLLALDSPFLFPALPHVPYLLPPVPEVRGKPAHSAEREYGLHRRVLPLHRL